MKGWLVATGSKDIFLLFYVCSCDFHLIIVIRGNTSCHCKTLLHGSRTLWMIPIYRMFMWYLSGLLKIWFRGVWQYAIAKELLQKICEQNGHRKCYFQHQSLQTQGYIITKNIYWSLQNKWGISPLKFWYGE